jgi:allene oxide cyclase
MALRRPGDRSPATGFLRCSDCVGLLRLTAGRRPLIISRPANGATGTPPMTRPSTGSHGMLFWGRAAPVGKPIGTDTATQNSRGGPLWAIFDAREPRCTYPHMVRPSPCRGERRSSSVNRSCQSARVRGLRQGVRMSSKKHLGHRRKAAAAVVIASVVAGGAVSMAGGATAESATTEAGWPGASAGASSAPASASARGADLVVQTRETRAAGVDLGEAGDSPGDFFHFEERAYRPGTQDVIGRDAVRCELGIRTFQCVATIKVFGKGKIVVEGALFGEQDSSIAITGGTGRYSGVGGTLHLLEGAGGSSLLAFHFRR